MNQVKRIKIEPKKETELSTNVIVVRQEGDNQIEDKSYNANQSLRTVNYANGLHLLSALGVCILLCSPFILNPQYDAIRYPEYWYEILMTFSLTYPIQWTLLAMLDNHFLLKVKALRSLDVGLAMAFSPILAFFLIYCGLYIYWTFRLGYNFPMPCGNVIALQLFFPFIATMWYLIPKETRMMKNYRKQLTWFILYTLWLYWGIGVSFYHIFVLPLKMLPSNVQPITAIVLPLMRLFESKILKKLLSNCHRGDETILEAYTEIMSNVNYLLYVTITISNLSNGLTAFSILLVDVIGNLYQCFIITKLNRKEGFDEMQLNRRQKEKQNNVEMLALTEVLDILIPLSYTMTYIVAYYGPNRMLLNGIRHDYWKNGEEKSIENVLAAEALLFSVDFACLVFTTASLQYLCKINVLKEMCKALRKYWLIIATVTGATISKVGIAQNK